jgi:hypothetical protein
LHNRHRIARSLPDCPSENTGLKIALKYTRPLGALESQVPHQRTTKAMDLNQPQSSANDGAAITSQIWPVSSSKAYIYAQPRSSNETKTGHREAAHLSGAWRRQHRWQPPARTACGRCPWRRARGRRAHAESTAKVAAAASKTLARVSTSRVEERDGQVSAAHARTGEEMRGSVGGRRWLGLGSSVLLGWVKSGWAWSVMPWRLLISARG